MKQSLFFLLVSVVLTGILAACGSTSPTSTAPNSSMHHQAMGTMPGMNAKAPFDAQFIDSMILHHQGAIAMANQAHWQAQHPEIKQLAQTIVKTQQQEINQMKQWRTRWYPGLAPTQGMQMPVGAMQISTQTNQPFDLRFIDAMVSHHQAAIAMAKVAQKSAEHAQIKQLAITIIRTQQAEVKQLAGWKSQWYPG